MRWGPNDFILGVGFYPFNHPQQAAYPVVQHHKTGFELHNDLRVNGFSRGWKFHSCRNDHHRTSFTCFHPRAFYQYSFCTRVELGWIGFLFPHLMPLGQRKAIIISSIVWEVWHIPAITQGINYPAFPMPTTFMGIGFCILLEKILSWLYLNTRSPRGSRADAWISHCGRWISMGLFTTWLVMTKRLPVQEQVNNEQGEIQLR